jgi:mycothiol synthase
VSEPTPTNAAPSAPPAPQQLQMVWPRERLADIPTWTVAPGYRLRTYRPGDEERYIQVMNLAGFATWSQNTLNDTLKACLPEGLFFAVHEASDLIVATAVAEHWPNALHPFGGQLGWVGCDPAHQGHALGYAVCAAVVRRFLRAEYTEIYLQTDDFRLAAVKTYLKLGFIPLLHAPDMEGRWQALCAKLGVDWETLGRRTV